MGNVPRSECNEVSERQCRSFPKQECHDEPELRCVQVPKVNCQELNRQSCQQVPVKDCQPKSPASAPSCPGLTPRRSTTASVQTTSDKSATQFLRRSVMMSVLPARSAMRSPRRSATLCPSR